MPNARQIELSPDACVFYAAVKDKPPSSGWKNVRWITRLDVVFANLYFEALESALGGTATIPKSWQALFEARQQTGIDRIQFALTGMNAHINHDLSLALLQTDSEFGLTPAESSPEHDDFEHVNGILEGVLPVALNTLATGIVGEIVQSTGKIGRLLAIWNVRVARDLAWDFADHLRKLSGVSRGVDVAEAKLAINPVDPYEKGYLAYLCARLGDRRRAESEAAQAMQLSRGANDDVRWVTALTYEAPGMHDRTLSVIEDAPAALVIRLNQTPEMAELRRLPRFQQLLKARQVE